MNFNLPSPRRQQKNMLGVVDCQYLVLENIKENKLCSLNFLAPSQTNTSNESTLRLLQR